MRKAFKAIILIFIAWTASSCMKSKLEATYNNQENQIDRYLEGKADMRVVRNGGANRLVVVEGNGEGLESDGFVSFYYAGYTFKGSSPNASNMFITNHEATAEDAGWNLTDPEYDIMEISLKDAGLIQGLKDGLLGVKAGEECEILFTGKYGFGSDAFGIIPANSALLYKIWVVGIANE